jgi:hypothetical protein
MTTPPLANEGILRFFFSDTAADDAVTVVTAVIVSFVLTCNGDNDSEFTAQRLRFSVYSAARHKKRQRLTSMAVKLGLQLGRVLLVLLDLDGVDAAMVESVGAVSYERVQKQMAFVMS